MANVKFAGDPEIKETGAGDGKAPAIPLSTGQSRVTEELLSNGDEKTEEPVRRRTRITNEEAQAKQNANAKGAFNPDDDDDEDDYEDPDAPGYERERIGARIGIPPEEAAKVEEVENNLDIEDKVPMMFPHKVMLNHDGLMHTFEAGLHLVPVSIGGVNRKDKKMHWYLRAHKVRHAGPVVKAQPVVEEEDAA
jgi:hypothetical protein